ncbi:MAG: phosphoribosyltransferase family protein [Reyranellaceae bacterium]
MTFCDRTEAGRRLAKALAGFKGKPVVVLALPRGGVPVAVEVAAALEAPLDLVLVRKIGVPGQPELAMGAAVEGAPPVVLRNESVIATLAIGAADFARVRDRELAELERRRQAYLADRPRRDVAGKVAILVDDGIATGMSIRAAARAMAARGAAEIVIAVPVAASDVVDDLRQQGFKVVCVEQPRDLRAIGFHYDDFRQVEDEAVRRLLASRREAAG